jgi:hypothetical protein
MNKTDFYHNFTNMRHIIKLIAWVSIIFVLYNCADNKIADNDSVIRPYKENPSYWEYKGQPVLLLGATDTDNLFQKDYLQSNLDGLSAIGGNYIRNTMSDRDEGDERAFLRNNDGTYDLSKWNDKYWEKFENMLKLTSERDVIVQIEVWDRFDHSRNEWLTDPYNPKNNINYTYTEAGLDSLYPNHPGSNQQPFFFTVPELNNNETLLQYQNAFVKKMLSHSLKYGNVLYCIDNETSGVEEWATYWANFIKDNSVGKEIYITQMWDTWDVKTPIHKRTIDHPELYGFIDISQNSQLPGYQNWENAQYVFNYIKDNPRPVNSTKIYGHDKYEPWLNRGMTTSHAIQSFFRNIIGGYASSRFHRPTHGLGLSEPSINSIKTIRKVEEHVKMWDIVPRMDLLDNVEENLAYISAKEGEKYVVYFTKAGKVNLNLAGHNHAFTLRWINIDTAEWAKTEEIKGGQMVDLNSIEEKGSLAVLIKK